MNRQERIPRDWLVDPVSKQPPVFTDGTARCDSGDYLHNTEHDYWDFTPHDLQSVFGGLAGAWQQLQENGMVSYSSDPARNLGVGERGDCRDFGLFCDYAGRVLDVGCGPQSLPAYFARHLEGGATFAGIDPLVGEQPRRFAFIRGLGEYLPFRNALFDRVVFATSLDHFLDPQPPLREALRVLAPGGQVCVWIGEKDRAAPRPAQSPEWYRSLKVPIGAEDPFHYRRFTSADFERYAAAVGLRIAEKSTIVVDQWRKNLFYRLVA